MNTTFCALVLAGFCSAAIGADNAPSPAAPADEPWPNYIQDVLAPHAAREPWLPAQHKNDPQLRAEFNRFLYFLESMGFFAVQYQDTKYPDFWPVFNQAFPLGFNNPDDSYYQAVIDDTGVYRISGTRGTVRILEFEIGAAEKQAYGRGGWAPSLNHYSLDDGVKIAADGSFDVVLSPKRPAGYTGDWWELRPGAKFILVRQRAYDWVKEVDGRLAIERLDVPAMRPRQTAADINDRMQYEGVWVKHWAQAMTGWTSKLEKLGLVNTIEAFDFSKSNKLGVAGGLTTQRYLQGVFELKDDEALILETVVPTQCKYWMFHLLDELLSSIDSLNRQTSLNGGQAVVDADGKFRAVISAQDPGVPNWLDTAGYARGVIQGRWWDCSSYPQPTVTKVNIADIRQHLPADTTVVSAEARDAAIRLRRKGAQMRKRW
jgi:Protein of unknown function (DUF1214)